MTALNNRKYISRSRAVIIIDRPWYRTYRIVYALLWRKVKTNLIKEDEKTNFNSEFKARLVDLKNGVITDTDMQNWLDAKQQEYTQPKYDRRYFSIETGKIKTTPSGFEKVPPTRLTADERAARFIDKLVYKFEPRVPEGFNLNVKYYEEDWRQELWKWCWEMRERNTNLRSLLTLSRIPREAYRFYCINIYGEMNRYIVCYIAKLQHSCNQVADYTLSNKYYEDVLYSDLSEITPDITDLSDEELLFDTLTNQEIVNKLMKALDDGPKISKYRNWDTAKTVLTKHYGLNPACRCYTLQEIADELGVTKQCIQQTEKWALAYLKERYSKKYKEETEC